MLEIQESDSGSHLLECMGLATGAQTFSMFCPQPEICILQTAASYNELLLVNGWLMCPPPEALAPEALAPEALTPEAPRLEKAASY